MTLDTHDTVKSSSTPPCIFKRYGLILQAVKYTMAKKTKKISMVEFPEEVAEADGIKVKVYGETSYENQMAVLSHYLHNYRKEKA